MNMHTKYFPYNYIIGYPTGGDELSVTRGESKQTMVV